MKTNIGTYEAGARYLLGLFVLFLSFHGLAWWGLLGLIPLVTGCARFCPLYWLLHIDTDAWERDREDHHHPGFPSV